MPLPDLLTAVSQEEALRFLLIGGHAVIAHGYARTTFDVDLLICREQLGLWLERLSQLGYNLERQETAFAQFSLPPSGENLDLMIVNATTFEGMWQGSLTRRIGDREVRIPSLDHLLALKLHVLKQDLGHRVIKDLDDVIHLVLANQVNVTTEHYQRLFEKYGTAELHQRVARAVSDKS